MSFESSLIYASFMFWDIVEVITGDGVRADRSAFLGFWSFDFDLFLFALFCGFRLSATGGNPVAFLDFLPFVSAAN